MENRLLTLILLGTLSIIEAPAQSSSASKEKVKPAYVQSYNQLGRDDYVYDPLYRDAETLKKQKEAQEAYEHKQKEKEALEKERKAKNKEIQKILQKKNKEEYDKAMKAYENRKKNPNTKNSIIISDKPI
ncbi:MAG TPA: hypothetical protein EYH57_05725 [Sulfurovum sp.]|nr:hypothetical protein [Sulfurovum sp.]